METVELNESGFKLSEEEWLNIHTNFISEIDFAKGGRKGSQKFPTPSTWRYLMRHYYFSKDEQSLQAVNTTLKAMANGGIYDHLGGGFSRYTVDPDWKVPHFEKMLYDNSQLVSLYSKAYQLTSDPFYQMIVEQSIAFIRRVLDRRRLCPWVRTL